MTVAPSHPRSLDRSGRFTGVKVFSATMQQEREVLGEKVTAWLAANPALVVVDVMVRQSSDEAFHCLSITVFYRKGA